MRRFRLGSVPYVNAAPLVWWFSNEGATHADVVYAVPSQLPALLASGDADAVLVSSIHALTVPDRALTGNVGVVSDGPVESVRLFSRVDDWRSVKSLALDPSSMTSNALAQIVLQESFGIRPDAEPVAGGLTAMLGSHDAAVLIGDAGLEADASGLNVLDLGSAWKDLTGLPFLWAAWTVVASAWGGASGDDGRWLDSELGVLVDEAFAASGFLDGSKDQVAQSAVIDDAARRAGWPVDLTRAYLQNNVRHEIDDRVRAGYREFGRRASSLGLVKVLDGSTA